MKFNFTKILIGLALILTLFLIGGMLNLVSAATLLVNPPFGEVEAGKDLSVDVVVQGSDELIAGVDANIAYDVNFLKVKEMKKGSFFSNHPILKDENGQVKITALAPKEGAKIFGDIVVVSLVFEILDSGNTKLTIAFQENATSESNVVAHASTKDLLTSVSGGDYKVEASSERLQEARARKAKQSGLIPVLIFIILLLITAVGIWYYRRKNKPNQDYFVPEAFPMDEVPKTEDPPKGSSSPPG